MGGGGVDICGLCLLPVLNWFERHISWRRGSGNPTERKFLLPVWLVASFFFYRILHPFIIGGLLSTVGPNLFKIFGGGRRETISSSGPTSRPVRLLHGGRTDGTFRWLFFQFWRRNGGGVLLFNFLFYWASACPASIWALYVQSCRRGKWTWKNGWQKAG